MNKFIYKLLVIILSISLIVVAGVGYYIKTNRVVDDRNYLEVIDTSEDFEYEPELDFEYIEERIIFSDEVENYLATMSDEEKIAQLFFVSPEDLSDEDVVTNINDVYMEYPVGGIVYSSNNINSISQARFLINDLNDLSLHSNGLRLLSTYDDEVPLSNFLNSDNNYTPKELSENGDDELVDDYIENRIYELNSFGFNTYSSLNINLDEEDDECFGKDPIYASEIVGTFVDTLKANNIVSFVKTFPVKEDTSLTLDELITSDLMVLQSAIDKDSEGVFLSNNICKSITESASTKVSMSENSFDTLRGRLGFDGLAIASNLKPDEILNAFLAGCDMFYLPEDYDDCYEVLLEALQNDLISSTRLNNAVGRIVEYKLK